MKFDKWERDFDFSGYVDIGWGTCLIFFTLYVLNDESIKPSDLIMVGVIGYQLLLIWIPTVFFVIAYIAPDDSKRIKALTSQNMPVPYQNLSFEPKLKAVKDYRKIYQLKVYGGMLYQLGMVVVFNLLQNFICSPAPSHQYQSSDMCKLLLAVMNIFIICMIGGNVVFGRKLLSDIE